MVTTYSSSDAEQSISISTMSMYRISPITVRACMYGRWYVGRRLYVGRRAGVEAIRARGERRQ